MNYDKVLSKNASKLQPSGIRKFFDIVATMEGAISLGVGEPDFITPWKVRDDAIISIKKGFTQYTSNAGIPKLRELISKYLSERFSLSYNPQTEIMVTVGASEAIDLALRALVESGDEVVVPQPSYVSYAPCVSLLGGIPVAAKCGIEQEFKLLASELEKAISKKTKAVILPYPNNPTGAIMEKEYLFELVKVLQKHPDVVVISDEIYAELTYGGNHVSIAEFEGMKERTILINGFSKSFAMTGWRLGFLCAPKPVYDVILKIHQYVIMCAPTVSQYAGISALENAFSDCFDMVGKMRDEYDKRRRFLVGAFNDIGLECFTPKGAFYVFPCVRSLKMNGEEFAKKLLDSKKVAVVPGSSFGESGSDFIRCSYAYSMKSLDVAMSRIEEFVNECRIG